METEISVCVALPPLVSVLISPTVLVKTLDISVREGVMVELSGLRETVDADSTRLVNEVTVAVLVTVTAVAVDGRTVRLVV